MENTLSQLSKEKKEIYLCGDINSDLLKIDTLKIYSRFYELLSSYGLVPFTYYLQGLLAILLLSLIIFLQTIPAIQYLVVT